MEKTCIYTIGHGNRRKDDFIALLKKYDIDYLVDVRTTPYSRFNEHFNQRNIQQSLGDCNINYVFMGDTLGGRPSDPSCYDETGKVDYNILQAKDFFKQGIVRLITANEKNIKIALMCSESNPCDCHRSKLIGRVLSEHKIKVVHIDEIANLKNQIQVINEINKGNPEVDLFGNTINFTSNKTYK